MVRLVRPLQRIVGQLFESYFKAAYNKKMLWKILHPASDFIWRISAFVIKQNIQSPTGWTEQTAAASFVPVLTKALKVMEREEVDSLQPLIHNI